VGLETLVERDGVSGFIGRSKRGSHTARCAKSSRSCARLLVPPRGSLGCARISLPNVHGRPTAASFPGTDWSKSTRYSIGRATALSPLFRITVCRTTRCTIEASSRSAVRRAPARYYLARQSAPAL
jgi:hypothetical protein